MKDAKKGFTLIELLLTVTMLTALGIGSATYYSRFFLSTSIYQAKDLYIMNLRKAQMYSALGRGDSNWGVRFGSNTMTLFRGNSYAARNTAFDQSSAINTNVAVTGLTELVFTNHTGIPSSTGTIVLTAANKTYTLTVNSFGVVTE